jgi:hypothetical protein
MSSLLDELLDQNLTPSSSLSDNCLVAMEHYVKYMDKQYGSEADIKPQVRQDEIKDLGLEMTGCSIFLWNVLMYGYRKIGEDAIANKLNSIVRNGLGPEDAKTKKRTGLVQFLIDHGWLAHYWNPDVYTPRDVDPEHPVSFQKVLDEHEYYKITDLSGVIVGYNKTTKDYDGKVTEKYVDENPMRKKIFAEFEKEKLCVGISRGADHTFFVSQGKVWEVHWAEYRKEVRKQRLPLVVTKGLILPKNPVVKDYKKYVDVKKEVLEPGKEHAWEWVGVRGDNSHKVPIQLYENTTSFIDFPWLSGLVLTPPESTFKSLDIAILRGELETSFVDKVIKKISKISNRF